MIQVVGSGDNHPKRVTNVSFLGHIGPARRAFDLHTVATKNFARFFATAAFPLVCERGGRFCPPRAHSSEQFLILLRCPSYFEAATIPGRLFDRGVFFDHYALEFSVPPSAFLCFR